LFKPGDDLLQSLFGYICHASALARFDG
jgi:hypothetical protein